MAMRAEVAPADMCPFAYMYFFFDNEGMVRCYQFFGFPGQ